MSGNPLDATELEDVTRRQADLVDRAESVSPTDPRAILELGAAVLLHRAVQVARSTRILPWLDPSVVLRIAEEQDRLAADLGLLYELLAADPADSDAGVLGEALLARCREHLRQDERMLLRPLRHLLAAAATAVPGPPAPNAGGPPQPVTKGEV